MTLGGGGGDGGGGAGGGGDGGGGGGGLALGGAVIAGAGVALVVARPVAWRVAGLVITSESAPTQADKSRVTFVRVVLTTASSGDDGGLFTSTCSQVLCPIPHHSHSPSLRYRNNNVGQDNSGCFLLTTGSCGSQCHLAVA